ncbi:unnamed protein product [Parajaminaea phylloscopi]
MRPTAPRWVYKISPQLWSQLHHFASFPQTGISLRQMVQFGRNPNPGTILQAGTFLAEELPIRLAHRVKELDELPNGLNRMPSIVRVKDWYAQSFEELVSFPKPRLPKSIAAKFPSNPSSTPSIQPAEDAGAGDAMGAGAVGKGENGNGRTIIERSTTNPAFDERAKFEDGDESDDMTGILQSIGSSANGNGNGSSKKRVPLANRYYANLSGIEWPPEVIDYNEQFTRTLEKIKKRHDAVVTTVAQGVLEYKRAREGENIQADVQRFLDRFYLSRIGIRILIGQHIALARTSPSTPTTLDGDPLDVSTTTMTSSSSSGSRGGGPSHDAPEAEQYVGIICTNTNVGAMAHEAIENARFVCEEHYGLFKGPPVQLVCPRNLTFMYVPSHLNHMLFELLKNSLRAVVERYGVENEDSFPPIKVVVVEGKEDITIKISDEGGGIPRSETGLVWTYMYTTAQSEDLDPDFNANDFKAPMAGFGYGLPLARLYARYFGGDLKLISMEGYGTDVYLHLNRLSSSSEPLP